MILQHLDLTHKSLSLPKISFNPGRVNAPNCLLKWFHYEDTEKNISSTTGRWTQEADENGGEMITFNEQGYNKYNLYTTSGWF